MAQQLAVFDIDGVLADNRHRQHHVARRPKDWDAFFAAVADDSPLPQGRDAVREAVAFGWTPVYLSGRPERCRTETLEWFSRFGFPAAELILRNEDDHRRAPLLKRELVDMLARRGDIVLVVDDDENVTTALAAAGYPVRLADWAPEDPPPVQQDSLFDE